VSVSRAHDPAVADADADSALSEPMPRDSLSPQRGGAGVRGVTDLGVPFAMRGCDSSPGPLEKPRSNFALAIDSSPRSPHEPGRAAVLRRPLFSSHATRQPEEVWAAQQRSPTRFRGTRRELVRGVLPSVEQERECGMGAALDDAQLTWLAAAGRS
jgi:hypothetical protein